MARSVPRFQRLVLTAAVVVGCIVALSRGGSAEEQHHSQAQLFGLTASGSSFVYVFDRSLSMRGQPLAAAKKELVASINRLTRVQQFQIIFYNEKARTMQPPQMAFADENGLRSAESYIASVSASGGTD